MAMGRRSRSNLSKMLAIEPDARNNDSAEAVWITLKKQLRHASVQQVIDFLASPKTRVTNMKDKIEQIAKINQLENHVRQLVPHAVLPEGHPIAALAICE